MTKMAEIIKFEEKDAVRTSEFIMTLLDGAISVDTPDFAVEQLREVYSPKGIIEMVHKKKKIFLYENGTQVKGILGIEDNIITTFFAIADESETIISEKLLEYAEDLILKRGFSHVKINSSIRMTDFFRNKGYNVNSDIVIGGERVGANLEKSFLASG